MARRIRALPQHPSETDDTAASYERVSTMAQAEFGYGLKVSGRDVDDMAREHGLNLPAELRFVDGVDQNASGTDWTLPALNAMLDLAKAGRFKTLLVPATDRFTRDTPKGLTLTAQLASYGVRVIWGNLPQIEDTSGHPMKRYIQRRMESDAFQLAELEREMITFRTARARHAKVKDGRVVGNGPPPFGYIYQRADDQKHRVIGLAPEPKEAAIVTALFKQARKVSTKQLEAWLNAEGIPTPRQMREQRSAPAGGWSFGTIAGILNNEVYAGRYRYGDEEIPVWPLVDQADFDAVQQAFTRRHRRSSGWAKKRLEREDPFILRGLLECGHCSQPGQPQILHSQAKLAVGRRYYWCANKFASRTKSEHICPLPGIRAEVIEAWLWRAVVTAIGNVEELDYGLQASQERRDAELAQIKDRLAAIEQEVAKYQKRLDRATAKLLDDEFDDIEEKASTERTRDEAKAMLQRLRAEKDRQVAETRPAGLSAEDIEAFRVLLRELSARGLDKATPSEQREILELLGIRGVVRSAAGGRDDAVLVQESPARYAWIEWSGEIRLHSDSAFKKLRLDCTPTPRFALAG